MGRLAATAALTLVLTACSGGEPESAPTPTARTARETSTPTPTPTPTPSKTYEDTPAGLADEFRDTIPQAQLLGLEVTGIVEKKDGITEVMTTLTQDDNPDDAVGICVYARNFFVDREGSPLAKVRLRVRDNDLRVVADDLNGRCAAR